MQAGADGDDAIGLGDHVIGAGRAERAEDANIVGMAREQPLALERGGERRFQPLGQRDQPVLRPDRATARQNHGPPGRGDHADGLIQRVPLRHESRRVKDRQDRPAMRHFLPHQVRGHVHDDGPPLDPRAVESGGDILGGVGRRAHLLEPGPGCFHNFTLVDILRILRRGHRRIARQQHDRHPPAHPFGQRGRAIGQRRAVGDRGQSDLARDLRIGQRHQHRTALMRNGNEGAAAFADVVVHHEQVGIAHQTEDRVDAVIQYRLRDGLVAVSRVAHGSPPRLCRVRAGPGFGARRRRHHFPPIGKRRPAENRRCDHHGVGAPFVILEFPRIVPTSKSDPGNTEGLHGCSTRGACWIKL